jgi:hypothetical protein
MTIVSVMSAAIAGGSEIVIHSVIGDELSERVADRVTSPEMDSRPDAGVDRVLELLVPRERRPG